MYFKGIPPQSTKKINPVDKSQKRLIAGMFPCPIRGKPLLIPARAVGHGLIVLHRISQRFYKIAVAPETMI